MKKSNYVFQIPRKADLTLQPSLSARLKEFLDSAQDELFQLCLYAAGLRNQYLDKTKRQYRPEFVQWYEKQEIDKLLGKLPSFTKYALAGETIAFFANQFKDGKYVKMLPMSRNALYELSLLKDKLDTKELEKLFYSGGYDDEALISPNTNSSDLAAYRGQIERQTSASSTIKGASRKSAKSKTYTIPLATIYVHRDLYKFNKSNGSHEGSVDIGDVKKAIQILQNSLTSNSFDVRSNLPKISGAYQKKKDGASPSRKLRKQPSKKKAS